VKRCGQGGVKKPKGKEKRGRIQKNSNKKKKGIIKMKERAGVQKLYKRVPGGGRKSQKETRKKRESSKRRRTQRRTSQSGEVEPGFGK